MSFLGRIALITGLIISTMDFAFAQLDWKDKLSVSGDMRMRVQRRISSQNAGTTGTTDDWIPQFRGRLNIAAKVNDSLTSNFRIGTSASTGRSHMQTLSPMNDAKAAYLTLGYFDLKASDSTHLYLGKMPNLFYQPSTLVWGPDQTFEGASVKFVGESGNLKPYLTATYANIIDRVTQPNVDLFAWQAGSRWNVEPVTMNAAVAFYNYNFLKYLPSVGTGSWPCSSATSCYGNSSDGTRLLYDYRLTHASLEIAYQLGFAPIAVFADYVQNADTSQNNTGAMAGVSLGSLKDQGSWLVRVEYRDLAKDATVGYFTDSTFQGGGTDLRGHLVTMAYQVLPSASLSLYRTSGSNSVSTTGYSFETTMLELSGNF